MTESEIQESGTSAGRISVPLKAVFFLLVGLSLAPRLVDFDASLLGPHFFRQTQTAISIWSLLEFNASPFSYETPIFGPPWRVPFEFPIFQMTAAGLVVLGVSGIDQAARIANLLYFYFSAAILYYLCRRFLESSAVAAFVVLVYLWCPFNIFWSRTAMIDFAAVSFALAYLYCFEVWLNDGGAKFDWRLALTVVCGILAYLSKGTTVPAVLVPIACLSVNSLFPSISRQAVFVEIQELLKLRKSAVLGIVAAVLLPALCGYGWVLYGDRIKQASRFTEPLVSSRLSRFLHGPQGQNLDLAGWDAVFGYLRADVFPYFSILLIPLGMLAIYRYSPRSVSFVYAMLVSAILTIAYFFNLYRIHDYYLMAVTANLSVVAGVGAHYLACVLPKEKGWLSILVIPPVLLSYTSGLNATEQRVDDLRKSYAYVSEISEALKRTTDPGDYVAVRDFDWNSAILYYARRRGFMVWPAAREFNSVVPFLKENGFTTIVYKQAPDPPVFNWRHHRELARIQEWRIAKVWDDGPSPAGLLTIAPGQTNFAIDAIHTASQVGLGQVVKIPADVREFVVSGWAVDEPALDTAGGVFIEIDGKPYQATFPSERPDVADYFKNPAYVLSGFAGHINTAEVGKGRHVLSIKILTNDGNGHYAPAVKFNLEIE